jgi:hypothetical protein
VRFVGAVCALLMFNVCYKRLQIVVVLKVSPYEYGVKVKTIRY